MGEYIEASVIGFLLVFNAALGVLHEGRAQATIDALKSRLALWASVRRDATWREIPAAELVPGDVVKVSLGSVVPADVRLFDGDVLSINRCSPVSRCRSKLAPDVKRMPARWCGAGKQLPWSRPPARARNFGRTAELVRTAHVTSSQQCPPSALVDKLAD